MTGPVDQERFQRQLAQELIYGLNAGMRVVRYHDTDNDASQSALNKLQGTLAKLFDQHYDVSVLFYAHDFYVNDVRVKPNASNFELFESLATQLEERGVGTIDIHVVPSRDDLATFVTALFGGEGAEGPPEFAEIVERLKLAEVESITLQPYVTAVQQDLPVIEKAEFVRQAYFRAIPLMAQLYQHAAARRPLALKKATRVSQNFVDVITDEDGGHAHMLLLLTRVKNYHGYLPNHAVNTSVLAVGFGHAIGMDRGALRALGLAAILADIGNAVLPETIWQQTEALDPAQIRVVREHPVRGVALVAGFQQLGGLVVSAAMGCAEHHRGGKTGYPGALPPPTGINAAIIAVCDRYDALTTARPHRPTAAAPAQALSTLAADGTLDPAIVNAFCWWRASLPGGDVVQNASGELELVVHPADPAVRQAAQRINADLSKR